MSLWKRFHQVWSDDGMIPLGTTADSHDLGSVPVGSFPGASPLIFYGGFTIFELFWVISYTFDLSVGLGSVAHKSLKIIVV